MHVHDLHAKNAHMPMPMRMPMCRSACTGRLPLHATDTVGCAIWTVCNHCTTAGLRSIMDATLLGEFFRVVYVCIYG
jgi:hypothetical protein